MGGRPGDAVDPGEPPWPGGVLGFLLATGLAGAAITEWIGIHAIFGAFLAGIALGDSPHLRQQTRQIVHRFVEGVLRPSSSRRSGWR